MKHTGIVTAPADGVVLLPRTVIGLRNRLRLLTPILGAILICVGCGRSPSSIDLSTARVTIYGAGGSKDVGARVLDSRARYLSDKRVSWTSANPAIAEVGGTGHIIGRSPGTTRVTASLGAISKTVSVEVKDVSKIVVGPAFVNLVGPLGTAMQLDVRGKTARGLPASSAGATFQSQNPKIAEVSADGTVRSVGNGKTTILVHLGDLLGEADVVVALHAISRLEIRPDTAILRIGETQLFTVVAYDDRGQPVENSAAQFSTNNTSVIALASDGTVTALERGSAYVTATLGASTSTASVIVN